MPDSDKQLTTPQQVVFIDSRVPDIQDLLSGLQPGEQAFVIDQSSDGLQQIANILAANDLVDLSAISIVSHGEAGELALGSSQITDGNLSDHSGALATIGASLGQDGAIQLYGCDVAAGAAGQQFISDLSRIAGGVSVEASTHPIGETATGENWTLDVMSGQVSQPSSAAAGTQVSHQAANPFTVAAEAQFSGTLATPTTELWMAATAGGSNNLILHSDDTGTHTASNIGTLFTPVSANNPSVADGINGTDLLQFDTQDQKYFIATQDTTATLVLEGSLASALADPTATPTFTTLFSSPTDNANHIGLTGLAVDPTSQQIFFDDGHNFYKESYSGSTNSETQLGSTGSASSDPFLDGLALDLPHHVAYFLSGTSQETTTTTKSGVVLNPNTPNFTNFGHPSHHIHYHTVFDGSIYETSDLTASSGSNSVTISKLVDFGSTLGTVLGIGVPGLAVDTHVGTHGIVYFTTETVAGVNATEGGIFWIDPTDNTHTIHTLFRQDGVQGPTGTLGAIQVDDATGLYYVSVVGPSGEGGQIWVGNLSTPGTPTLFETLPTFNSGTTNPIPAGFAIDNAPTLTATSSNPTFTESALNPASAHNTPVALISSAVASDTDNDKLAGATVTESGGFSGSGDSLYVLDGVTHRVSGTFTGTNITVSETTDGNGNETLTLTGTDSLANYQTVLDDVQFTSTSDNPTNYGNNSSRTVAFSVYDGLQNSAAVTSTVTVVATDDAPVNNTGGVSAAGNEDSTFSITGLTITDADADPANQNIQVTLSVGHGTLTLKTNVAGGITAGEITAGANGSDTVTITATQDQINATLGNATGLQYHGDLNFNTGFSAENLHIVTSDLGHTGSGGPLTDTDDVAITVNAVNDNPNLQPGTTTAVGYTENAAATALFSGENVDSPLTDVDQSANYGGGSIDLNITAGAVAGDRISLTGSTFHISGGHILDSSNVDLGTISGNGTSHVTISALTSAATPTEVDAVLQSFGYDSTSDDPGNGARTITLTFNDGGNTGSGGALTDSVTQTVNVTAVNDAPVATITPASYAATEQTSLSLKSNGLSVSDVDGETGSETVTLSVTEGTLTVTTGTSGAAVTNSGTSSVTISGTIAEINDLLNTNGTSTVSYIDNTDTPSPSATLTLLIHDNGNTGTGGDLSASDTAIINITAVNDAPVVTAGGTLAYTENDGPKVIAAGASVTDVDSPDFNTGSLTVAVSGSHAEDQLLILQDATVDVEAGGIVSVNGNVIGTIDVTHDGVNGASLEIDFNSANATPGAVTTLMDHIEYANSSDDPSTAARTVTFTVNDGDGGTSTGSATSALNVTAVNDAPVATITPASYVGQPNVAIDLKTNGLSVSDVDGENGSETVTLSVTSGTLTATAGGSGAGVSGTGTGTLTITGTIAEINAFLNTDATSTVSFLDPTGGVKTLTLTIHDNGNTGGGDLSAQDTAQLVLDQPPVVDLNGASAGTGVTLAITENQAATVIAPAGLTTDSDSTDFNGGSLTVHVGVGDTQDQLSILTDATVTVAADVVSVSGLAVGTVTGAGANGSDLVVSFNTADATPAAISTLIEHIQYADTSDNPAASRSITFTVDDGDGSSGSAVATVNITAVNDGPAATITPASYSATEQTSLDLKNNGLAVSDVDGNSGSETVTLSVTEGTLTATAGTSGAGVSGNGTGALTITGTIAQINAFLNTDATSTVSYIDNSDTPGASTQLTLTIHDNGNTGGGDLSSTANATINITAVNDAPTAVMTTDPYSATEQTTLDLKGTGMSVGDVDSLGSSETVTLSVGEGTLFAAAGDSGVTIASGSGTSQVIIDGTIAQLDAFLGAGGTSTLSYIDGSDDPSASTTLTLAINDNGNTGTGGAQVASHSSTINVTAVNDAPVAAITPVSYAATEAQSLDLKNSGLSVSDVDGNLGTETVKLSVSEGVLNVTAGGTPVSVTNSGSSVVTLTGTVTDINALLNTDGTSAVSYIDNNVVPAASATLTLTIHDNGNTGGGDLSSTAVVPINITAVDNVPALTGLTDTPGFTEKGPPVLLDTNQDATVSDAELDLSPNHYQGATLTIERSGGPNPDDTFGATGSLDLVDHNGQGENVSLDGGATFIGTFINPGDGSFNFDFNANATAADINSVMRQIVYADVSDNPPTDVPVNFIFNDGNGLPGGQDQGTGTGVATATIDVHVTQVDDPPVLLNVALTQGYAVGSAGVILSPALQVFDPDATPPSTLTGIASATVSITNGFQATDQLFVDLSTSGGFFIVDDGSGPVVTNIAVASDAGGVLTLTGQDTTQHYQDVLDAVSYHSTAVDPTAGGTDPGRTIDWQVSDGLLSSPNPGAGVNETLLNFVTAPQLDLDASGGGTGFTTTFTENGAPLAITASDVSVTAPGVADIESATIVLTNAKAGDGLSIAGALPGGIDSTIDTSVAGQITVHLINPASAADYQTALEQIRFVNTSDNPDTTDRDIAVHVTDVEGDSNDAHSTVHVIAVNDPPVNTVPGSLSGVVGAQTEFSGLSIADPDAVSLTTQLHVDNGVLNVGTFAGGAAVSGSGSATVTLTGSVAQIDATLHANNNVLYQSNFVFAGTDHLTMTTNDGGGTGIGGPMTDTDTVVINVGAPAIGGGFSQSSVVGSPGVTAPNPSVVGDSSVFSHIDLHGFHLI